MTKHRLAAGLGLAFCTLFTSSDARSQSAGAPSTRPVPAAPTPAPAPVADDASKPKPPSANDVRARELYEQADVAYSEGKYSLALVLFRESYALSNRALILIAMANTQERLGDLQGALDNLRSYATQTDISQEPNIEQRILALEKRTSAAAARAEQERLAREAAAANEPIEPTPPATEPAPMQASSPASRTWPWIVVGSGSAALLAGVSFALVASSARGKVDDQCEEASNGDLLCLPGAQKYLDRDSNFSLLADISIGVGVAAIATGVVFLMLPADEDRSTSPNFAVGPDSMSVTLQGSF